MLKWEKIIIAKCRVWLINVLALPYPDTEILTFSTCANWFRHFLIHKLSISDTVFPPSDTLTHSDTFYCLYTSKWRSSSLPWYTFSSRKGVWPSSYYMGSPISLVSSNGHTCYWEQLLFLSYLIFHSNWLFGTLSLKISWWDCPGQPSQPT